MLKNGATSEIGVESATCDGDARTCGARVAEGPCSSGASSLAATALADPSLGDSLGDAGRPEARRSCLGLEGALDLGHHRTLHWTLTRVVVRE